MNTARINYFKTFTLTSPKNLNLAIFVSTMGTSMLTTLDTCMVYIQNNGTEQLVKTTNTYGPINHTATFPAGTTRIRIFVQHRNPLNRPLRVMVNLFDPNLLTSGADQFKVRGILASDSSWRTDEPGSIRST